MPSFWIDNNELCVSIEKVIEKDTNITEKIV